MSVCRAGPNRCVGQFPDWGGGGGGGVRVKGYCNPFLVIHCRPRPSRLLLPHQKSTQLTLSRSRRLLPTLTTAATKVNRSSIHHALLILLTLVDHFQTCNIQTFSLVHFSFSWSCSLWTAIQRNREQLAVISLKLISADPLRLLHVTWVYCRQAFSNWFWRWSLILAGDHISIWDVMENFEPRPHLKDFLGLAAVMA